MDIVKTIRLLLSEEGAKLIKAASAPPTLTATVSRMGQDGTAWVLIDGGSGETPATQAVACKAGDRVTVVIERNKARITGNVTAPPTDDTKAYEVGEETLAKANATAKELSDAAYAGAIDAVGAVEVTANAALETANATNQHFWTDDAGVHVSSEAEDATGARNALWNSTGMLFRKAANNLLALATGNSPGVAVYDGSGNAGSNIVAQFTASLAQLGYAAARHVNVTSEGVYLYHNANNLIASFNTNGLWQRVAGAVRLALTSTGLELYDTDGATSTASFGSTSARVGKNAAHHVSVTSTGVSLWKNASTKLAEFVDTGVNQYVGGTLASALSATGLTQYVGGTIASALTSAGLNIYSAGASVAEFANTVRIGKASTSRALIDYHSLQMVDKGGGSYFQVIDLRDSGGTATVVEEFYVQTRDTITLGCTATNTTYSIVEASAGTAVATDTKTTTTFRITTAAYEAVKNKYIKVTYTTTSTLAKSYTLGTRKSGQNSGPHSYVEGYTNVAGGLVSHAEGLTTEARGKYSHAEGWSTLARGTASHAGGHQSEARAAYSYAHGKGAVAASSYQTVIGRYNAIDSSNKYALIIGYGDSNTARRNAFAVTFSGKAELKSWTTAEFTRNVTNVSSVTSFTCKQCLNFVQFKLTVVVSQKLAAQKSIELGTLATSLRPAIHTSAEAFSIKRRAAIGTNGKVTLTVLEAINSTGWTANVSATYLVP